MPTVIDALVITLGLDPSGVEKGRRQTSESLKAVRADAAGTAKELEVRGKAAANFFGEIRKGALALSAIATGAVAMRIFGQNAAAGDAAVGRLARNIGMATDRLDAYGRMAERVGGTREGLASSLQSIQDQVNAPAIEGTPMNRYWVASGIRTAEAGTGRQRPTEEIAMDVVRYLRTKPENQQSDYARGLGVGQEFVGFARMSDDRFQSQLAETRRLGNITQRQVEEADRLVVAWSGLRQAFDTSDRLLRERFGGSVTDAVTGLESLVTYLNGPELKPAFEHLAAAVKEATSYLASPEMLADLKAFGERIRDISQSILNAIRWIQGKLDTLGLSGGIPGITRPTGENAMTRLYHSLGLSNLDGSIGTWRPGDRDVGTRFWDWALGRQSSATPSSTQPQPGGAEGAPAPALLNMIGRAEGTDRGRGYNETLAYGAYSGGPQNLVGMTLDQIDQLQTEMLNHPLNSLNSSAVGRYQIVRSTLRGLRSQLGLNGNEVFDQALQDRLGMVLAERRGLGAYRSGQIDANEFQRRLSREWASIPNPDTGRGAYAGQRRPGLDQEAIRRALGAARGQEPVAIPEVVVRPGGERGEEPLPNPSLPRGPDAALRSGALRDLNAFNRQNFAGLRGALPTTSTSTSTTEVNTGPITITTAATDARGIAGALRDELRRRMPLDQAATGLA